MRRSSRISITMLIVGIRLVETLAPLQNTSGGFAGGHGQYSHLATSYAAVLCLAMVGGDAIRMIDRMAMYGPSMALDPSTHLDPGGDGWEA